MSFLKKILRLFRREKSPESVPAQPTEFETRLKRLDALEQELTRKAAQIIQPLGKMYYSDFFLLAAVRRTLAQSAGFRDLMAARNFPCAAAILRMQIDTAMRVNGLRLVGNIDAFCRELLHGKQYNRMKDSEGKILSDAHLRRCLSDEHPWINSVYETTSDIVHLSLKHFYTSIVRTEDDTRTVHLQIGGKDPPRPDEDYFEIIDGFFEATQLAAMLILACLSAQHQTVEPET